MSRYFNLHATLNMQQEFVPLLNISNAKKQSAGVLFILFYEISNYIFSNIRVDDIFRGHTDFNHVTL
jgi:hypothetical protein